jgi:hypothetical protein
VKYILGLLLFCALNAALLWILRWELSIAAHSYWLALSCDLISLVSDFALAYTSIDKESCVEFVYKIPFWIYCGIYLELLGICLLFRDLVYYCLVYIGVLDFSQRMGSC